MKTDTLRRTLVLLGIMAVLTVMAAALGGCAGLGVQPWERAQLSEPGMAIDADPIQTALNEHIYFSKEASTGGLGTAGGGCGCN